MDNNNNAEDTPSNEPLVLVPPAPEHHNTLSHVHENPLSSPAFEMTPPHPPREETPVYRKSHAYLVHILDKPCVVCGVKQSTLGTNANRYGAQALETHHYPIERSLMDACDPLKVHAQFSEVLDRTTLEAFIDSPRNLLVLCDICHRSPLRGIHHLLVQDFAVLPFLFDGYVLLANEAGAEAALSTDDAIEKEHGYGSA